MNNLPKTIESTYGTLELPQCESCEGFADKNNPVKEYNERMTCWSCEIDRLYDEFFPRTKKDYSIIEKAFDNMFGF